MTRQKSIDFINQSNARYFTYGLEGSDLGTPIERESALVDILNMDDDSWADGEVFECTKEADNADLVAVAEAILDAKEFLAENTKSIATVQAYAENGMGITLSSEQAKSILYAILLWQWGTEQGELNGTDAYYYTITAPLENFEPEWMPTILITKECEEPCLYDLESLYDIFNRGLFDTIEMKAIEEAFLQVDDVISFVDFQELATSYEKIKDLDDLFNKMMYDHPAVMDKGSWSTDLPNFGGERPDDTDGIWSWDEKRMIVGTCNNDLQIIER